MPLPLRPVRSFVLCSLAATAIACGTPGGGDSDAGPPRDAGPATIELGTGDIEFLPMAEGSDQLVVQGPQGGFHFVVSVRVTGIDPGNVDDRTDLRNPTTEFQAWVGDQRMDLMASRYTQAIPPAPDGSGTYDMIGRLLILRIASDDEIANMMTRIEVTVTSPAGITLYDERNVLAVPHPLNP
ncbi:MAG: hypothetical protein AB7S26_00645 [Sandaracinaceae bacterium]